MFADATEKVGAAKENMAGTTRLELATSAVTEWQLAGT